MHNIAITPEFLTGEKISKFNRLTQILQKNNFHQISNDIVKVLTREASPEGIVAEIDIPNFSTEPILSEDRVLFLYKISNPGNLGTLLRTARALDWNRVVLIDDCVDPFNPETVRSSMGSSLKTAFSSLKSCDLRNYIEKYRINLLMADKNGKSVDYYGIEETRRPIGLLLGSEANGFKGLPKGICDSFQKICVKMSYDTESLNVAICGGILMYNLISK